MTAPLWTSRPIPLPHHVVVDVKARPGSVTLGTVLDDVLAVDLQMPPAEACALGAALIEAAQRARRATPSTEG